MNRTQLLLSAGLALASMLPLYAQSKGQTPAPTPAPAPSPGGGRTTPPPTPTPSPNIPSQQQQQQQQPGRLDPFASQPIFLSGKVVMDDGTPPPEPVIIELVCGASRRPQAYTSSKGSFSFQVGQNTPMPDASVSAMDSRGYANPPGGPLSRGNVPANLMGCDLVANLAGYRSDVVNLGHRRGLDNPDVGTLVLHRLANVEGTTISATSLAAPKDAKKAFDKGTDAMRKQKWEEAQKQFQKAVDAYPKYASAWFELGQAYMQQKNADEARKAYTQSLGADPKYVKPLAQLSAIAAREQKWQEVADTTDRLLRLDRFSFPEAFYYNSLANFQLHKLDAAEKSARELVKMDAEHKMPKANHLLGVILANKGTYPEAAENMRLYLQLAPNASDTALVKKQLSQLESEIAKAPAPQQ